jgi:hypothetical protein
MMENVFEPLVCALTNNEWGDCEQESQEEFTSITSKFVKEVKEAIKLM